MSTDPFSHDVFLSHNSKEKPLIHQRLPGAILLPQRKRVVILYSQWN